MRLELGGIGVRVTNASGALTGVQSLCSRIGLVLIPTRTRKRGTVRNTSPKARGEGLPCSNSGLKCANRRCDYHA
ncbi:MAG: hypothetical protein ACK5YR_01300, partial [Pirellula sp.]